MTNKLIINEGMVKKGGVNPKPSTPRPAEPPKAQSPKLSDNQIELKIVKTHPNARNPTYATEHSSGMDLYSTENYILKPQETIKIDVGLRLELPIGYEGQIRGRSGLASKGILTHFGTIDNCFRGNICVILYNSMNQIYEIKRGDRIGQLIITPVLHQIKIKEITLDELTRTERGENGFGSSGK